MTIWKRDKVKDYSNIREVITTIGSFVIVESSVIVKPQVSYHCRDKFDDQINIRLQLSQNR